MGFVPFKLMGVSESSFGGEQQQLKLTNVLDALGFYFGRRLVCLFPTGGTSNLAKPMDFIGAVASVPLMVTISQAVDGALFAKETEDFKPVNTDQSAA